MAFHGTEKPAHRVSLRDREIFLAVDRPHDDIPGRRQRDEGESSGDGVARFPELAPAGSNRQIQHDRHKRHQKSNGAFRQRRHSHADVEEPEPASLRTCSAHPEPEPVERGRRKKHQDTVGQRHAAESDNLDIEQ